MPARFLDYFAVLFPTPKYMNCRINEKNMYKHIASIRRKEEQSNDVLGSGNNRIVLLGMSVILSSKG